MIPRYNLDVSHYILDGFKITYVQAIKEYMIFGLNLIDFKRIHAIHIQKK